eukprot:6189278-Pleurochrysis_carterae.AAC.1
MPRSEVEAVRALRQRACAQRGRCARGCALPFTSLTLWQEACTTCQAARTRCTLPSSSPKRGFAWFEGRASLSGARALVLQGISTS